MTINDSFTSKADIHVQFLYETWLYSYNKYMYSVRVCLLHLIIVMLLTENLHILCLNKFIEIRKAI